MANRRVFITGGAHGIGKAIVEAFANEGYRVAFCDIDIEKGNNVAHDTGAWFIGTDVRSVDEMEACMGQLLEEWGDIDIIVNNVGKGVFKPLVELSVEEFDDVIATNLRPVFLTSRMLARHRLKNRNRSFGRIVNICSTRYLQSEAGTEAYSASKGGIYSLTHSLAMSLAPLGITVNGIAPGWIHVREDETIREEDRQFHPSGRVGEAADIARLCLFLCEDRNEFINGQTIVVDGGTTIKMIYPE